MATTLSELFLEIGVADILGNQDLLAVSVPIMMLILHSTVRSWSIFLTMVLHTQTMHWGPDTGGLRTKIRDTVAPNFCFNEKHCKGLDAEELQSLSSRCFLVPALNKPRRTIPMV